MRTSIKDLFNQSICLFPLSLPSVSSLLSLENTVLYILHKTLGFPPAEQLRALKPRFPYGREFAVFLSRMALAFLRSFFFALLWYFFTSRSQAQKCKKTPAPTSASHTTIRHYFLYAPFVLLSIFLFALYYFLFRFFLLLYIFIAFLVTFSYCFP